MERVAFYSRVSTTDEKQLDALDKQIEELRNFINKNPDWVLSGEYIDRGKTGTTKKGRDGYLALFEDISQDKFETQVTTN